MREKNNVIEFGFRLWFAWARKHQENGQEFFDAALINFFEKLKIYDKDRFYNMFKESNGITHN